MPDIDNLSIQITSDAKSAVSGVDALASSLAKLKSATSGGLGLGSVAKNLSSLKTSLSGMGNVSGQISGLDKAIKTLSNLGGIKISSSIGNQIKNIGGALSNLNIGDGATKITELVDALRPLETLGKSSLGTTVNALNKLPEAMRKIDVRKLHGQVDALTRTFRPLAEEMQKIANGFNAFPSRIQTLISSNERLSQSNNKTSSSYVNLWAKMQMAYNYIKTGAKLIGSAIKKTNDYIENVNLFNVSMGDYAKEAGEYAERVGEVMGIDPGEWMRNQGVFMTLATGFGVVSDRAYTMSKNLTQLGYDISSFFNISYEDAMEKLQSGLAGELEPLRRIGYDLSQARLQQEAYTLGITKKISAMTQAEKAELRYYAIMNQVTTAQGDMARTLNAPANQLRVLSAQFTQAARAIGSIFIPALNAVLPYVIAVTKVIRLLASTIASLFGFEMPEVDYSGVGSLASGAESASDALGGAADNAKKLQKYTMGFDELNVIDPTSGSSGAGGSGGFGGSGFDFELPEYDFLGEMTNSKIATIVEEMKKWLGLTGEINTWSEFFNTNLGQILLLVGEIGLGIAAWKITTGLMTGIAGFKKLLRGLGKSAKGFNIALAATVTVTSLIINWTALADAVKNGLDSLNFVEILGSGGGIVAGGAWLGKLLGSTIIGASIGAIVAGVPAFFVGIWDACKNGLNWLNGLLIPAGSTAAGAGIGAIIGSLGGPITAGAGALIGLAVGALTDLGIWSAQNWDKITSFFTETVPKWFSEIDWKAVGKSIGEGLFNALQFMTNPFGFLFNLLEDTFNFEIDWGAVGNAIGKGLGKAVKFIDDAATFIDEWFNIDSLTQKFINWFINVDWGSVWDSCVKFVTKDIPKWWNTIGSDIVDGIWEGISGKWNDFWKDCSEFISGLVDGFKEALGIHSPSTVFIEIAKEIVNGLIAGIIESLAKCKEKVIEWATSVKDWFTDKGEIFTNFKNYAIDIVANFKDKIGEKYTDVKSNITTWANKVKDWFTTDNEGTIFDKFTSYGSTLVGNLSSAIDVGVSQESYETIFNRIKTALDGLTKPLKQTINGIIGLIESMANKAVEGINWMIRGLNNLKFTIPDWIPGLGGKSFSLNIPILQTIAIPRLMADGGFVDTGQLFIAREAGAEMVGSIGRKTAVANNDQIVAGIASGVASANTESNALLREQNNLLRAMLEKETGVYLDGKSITKSVEKHQRERGRVLVTGGAY